MNINNCIPSTISSVGFTTLNAQDIRRISVKQITNPQLFDILNTPQLGGLYDPALGPLTNNDICATCSLTKDSCPGHFGHIELISPVYNPLFFPHVNILIRSICVYCHRFKLSRYDVLKYTAVLHLVNHGFLREALSCMDITARQPQASVAESRKRKRKAGQMEEDDSDAEDGHTETLEDFKQILQNYMTLVLGTAQHTRDSHKIASVASLRKEIIAKIHKVANSKRKCDNCKASCHRYRKDGFLRILELSLSLKQKAGNHALGIHKPSLRAIKFRADNFHKQNNAIKISRKGKEKASDEGTSDSESSDVDSTASSVRPPARERSSSVSDSSEDEGEDITGFGEENDALIADGLLVAKPKAKKGKSGKELQSERPMAVDEVRAHIRLAFLNEADLCSLLYSAYGPVSSQKIEQANTLVLGNPDIFFIQALSVPPTRFRPPSIMGDMTFENPTNELMSKVLASTIRMRERHLACELAAAKKDGPDTPIIIEERNKAFQQLIESMSEVQIAVNSVIDSTKNPVRGRNGKEAPNGIKQVLEKKAGLFRMNMMGKRVNHAARSVISPDVNIEPNEIGVPPVFATKLTFPEPVTAHNVYSLMQLVVNGPRVHPGATTIEDEYGNQISLDRMNDEERKALARTLLVPEPQRRPPRPDIGLPVTRTPQTGKKVHRHLTTGDIVIMNRQPTLHKPSMMCHKVRVLKGEKTIRMHYANCNSYNADFDGDEMNMHFPQSIMAQAEARLIANTDNQYLVPTSGDPLRGLIQDHVVASVWMTNKHTFFSRAEYHQLIYTALKLEETSNAFVELLPPAILRPRSLWTGKQIISTILLNVTPKGLGGLNLTAKAKVPGRRWGLHTEEEIVQFVDGELLTGILDKSQFGASAFGMVHSVYELYGSETAGKLLGVLSRLFTLYLQHRGFTCGMDDLQLVDAGNRRRSELSATAESAGFKAASRYVNLPDAQQSSAEDGRNLKERLEEVLRDDIKQAGLDREMMGEGTTLTSQIIDECLPSQLLKPFPDNDMQTMTVSGAKGSNVNVSQISCLLGQQALEGRRVPTMVSGKTLPSFKPFATALRAGGFVAQRFLTGIRPQEYYFHCMAGREGLIDTAVKTSRSGYLQRCLIKHLEGIRVHYDRTVRNSDSSVIQFHYGEDSLDVTRQKYLNQIEFAVRNLSIFEDRFQPKRLEALIDTNTAREYSEEIYNDRVQNEGSTTLAPTLSKFDPGCALGAVSEVYADTVAGYEASNPSRLLYSKQRKRWPPYVPRGKRNLIELDKFRAIMDLRYMKSLVDPGEAVGLLASQGVGEPSTQMTLNTFHLAGHGAVNVTLGIPRLREIVMTASANISSPMMKIPFTTTTTTAEQEDFVREIGKLSFSEVVDSIKVEERLSPKTAGPRLRCYNVLIQFYSRSDYQKTCSTTTDKIYRSVFQSLLPILDKEIGKELKRSARLNQALEQDVGQGHLSTERAARAEAAEGDDEEPRVQQTENEEADEDADDTRHRAQEDIANDYEAGDDESEASKDSDAQLEGEFPDDKDNDDDTDDGGAKPGVLNVGIPLTAELQDIKDEAVTKSKHVSEVGLDAVSGQWTRIQIEFDSDDPKLLLVGIIERACRMAVVRQIPGITRCLRTPPEKKDPLSYCTTEGANLMASWTFGVDTLDLNNLYTNDIAAFVRIYGVEAGRAGLIKEISNVFGAYGIGVDKRHLTLIADYMTAEGGFKPFNRAGLSNNTSPFLKASFETTGAFVTEAALFGDFDDLSNPSANIIMGQLANSGSGSFRVLAQPNSLSSA